MDMIFDDMDAGGWKFWRWVIVAVVGFSLAFFSIWVLTSAQEAKAYNRLTGSHVTTWDAMWVQLRVQGLPAKE